MMRNRVVLSTATSGAEASFQGHLDNPGTAVLGARLDGLLAGPIQAEVLAPRPIGDGRGML